MNNLKKILTLVILFTLVLNVFKSPSARNKVEKEQSPKAQSSLFKIPNHYKLTKEFDFVPKASAQDLDLDANSYIVTDYNTGRILESKNSDKRVPIASVTKTMSAVVALDLANPDELITISENAQNEIPTKIGIIAGQKMTVKELMEAMLLTSANDASQALADGIDEKYKTETFVKAMNEKARFIGLKDSNFANPQGFDSPNNYSSAQDLAILSHYALENYSLIKAIVAKDYLFLPENQNHKQFDLYNWNGLLDVYPGASGIKIGNTSDAGYTTVVVSERNGKKVLAVVLGTPGVLQRDIAAATLLDKGFSSFGIGSAKINEQQFRDKYSTWKYFN